MIYYGQKVNFLMALGGHYRANPMDLGKPLLMVLAGVLPQWAFTLLWGAAILAVIYALCRLAQRFAGSIVPGLATFGLYLFANTSVLGEVAGFIEPFYIVFPLLALMFFVENRQKAVSVCLLCAGQIRPEFWFLSFIYVLSRVWPSKGSKLDSPPLSNKDGGKAFDWHISKIWLVLPMLAPFLWILSDLAVSHGTDMFYSQHLTHLYASTVGRAFVPFNLYFPLIATMFTQEFCGWAFWAGFVLGAYMLWLSWGRAATRNPLLACWLLALTPVIFFALACATGQFVMFIRFFQVTALIMYFFLTIILYEIFRPRLKILVMIAVVLLSFNKQNLMDNIENLTKARYSQETLTQTESYLDRHELTGHIVSGFSMDTLSLRYGEEFSSRSVNIREIAGGARRLQSGDHLIKIFGDTSGKAETMFSFLQGAKVKRYGFVFDPIYVTQNRLGVIYKIKGVKE